MRVHGPVSGRAGSVLTGVQRVLVAATLAVWICLAYLGHDIPVDERSLLVGGASPGIRYALGLEARLPPSRQRSWDLGQG